MSETTTNGATPVVAEPLTIAERFVKSVERHFKAELGTAVQWDELQMVLAQHLYIKIDEDLKALQAKGKAVNWGNVNMTKLAINGVHLVNLGIDGLIPNHVSCVPYKDGALTKSEGRDMYTLALRPGYAGKLLTYAKASVDPIVRIRTYLRIKGDRFKPILTSRGDDFEYEPGEGTLAGSEEFEGGFGFIEYEDPRKNKLVLVTLRDFARSEAASKSKGTQSKDEETGEIVTTGNFWKANPVEMREKTVIHRTAEAIQLDPVKLNNVSLKFVNVIDVEAVEHEMEEEMAERANKTPLAIENTVTGPVATHVVMSDPADKSDQQVLVEAGAATAEKPKSTEDPY